MKPFEKHLRIQLRKTSNDWIFSAQALALKEAPENRKIFIVKTFSKKEKFFSKFYSRSNVVKAKRCYSRRRMNWYTSHNIVGHYFMNILSQFSRHRIEYIHYLYCTIYFYCVILLCASACFVIYFSCSCCCLQYEFASCRVYNFLRFFLFIHLKNDVKFCVIFHNIS